ncbi:hypothetical protein Bca52824_043184 [Brassica carinata]|uniref:Zinc finger GRF-type domain-containing protein n=1 Tax=Brassica carinata TaxID=52824 RepID=A0A8X7S0P5_BRACI|nr:hypothetical protein Bca52824_043184 [Brassica carinata]
MGQYSYSQPSSSEEYDIDLTSLLQAEADIYADEAESRQNIVESVEYVPQPEADDGIPKTSYCGGEPVVATSYTRKDQGRRYFTCENADDGDCHIWKWLDVAVMEEFGDYQRQLRELKAQADESEEKLVKVEKTVGELAKRKPNHKWLSTGCLCDGRASEDDNVTLCTLEGSVQGLCLFNHDAFGVVKVFCT